MLYKRQKILLSLIKEFGGCLTSTEGQKYLFLLSRLQDEPSYHFVPYKYGCFSFQAYHDKRILTEKEYLLDREGWALAKTENLDTRIPFKDAECIQRTKRKYGHLKGDRLLAYIYQNHPYYATNSRILHKILAPTESQAVEKLKARGTSPLLCSIGYEGKSLEEYLNCLLHKNIKVLCDVRKNPLSRKYGFSKSTLVKALTSLGIEYRHFPELGIESKKRGNLITQADYDVLFEEYEQTVLSGNKQSIKTIRRLIEEHRRIALTCYEHNPAQCHRTRVARTVRDSVNDMIDFVEV